MCFFFGVLKIIIYFLKLLSWETFRGFYFYEQKYVHIFLIYCVCGRFIGKLL